MTYLDYLPEIGKQTQYRFGQALAGLTYYPEIREQVTERDYVVFYLNHDAANYDVVSEKSAFAYTKAFSKDCQVFKLLKGGEALMML